LFRKKLSFAVASAFTIQRFYRRFHHGICKDMTEMSRAYAVELWRQHETTKTVITLQAAVRSWICRRRAYIRCSRARIPSVLACISIRIRITANSICSRHSIIHFIYSSSSVIR
jgi:hypothetical protein